MAQNGIDIRSKQVYFENGSDAIVVICSVTNNIADILCYNCTIMRCIRRTITKDQIQQQLRKNLRFAGEVLSEEFIVSNHWCRRNLNAT